MKKFAITGNPVTHSKSPVLFKAAYGSIYDMAYELMPAESAKKAVELFHTNGLNGMNVTAPFKTDILPYIDNLNDEVGIIGAVNTVVKSDDGLLTAYNTDYQGVLGAFDDFGVHLAGKKCLLLGIGGAGMAAAYALSNAGADLTIANRTVLKAEEFASKLGAKALDLLLIGDKVSGYDVIVNTLYPTIDCIDINWLHAEQVVMDASYVGSPLLEKAAQQGCLCIDGRYWILYQAIPAFRLFTGIEPDVDAMRKAILL